MLVNQLLPKPLKPIKPIKKNNVENLSHVIDPECSLKFIEDSDIKLYFIGDNLYSFEGYYFSNNKKVYEFVDGKFIHANNGTLYNFVNFDYICLNVENTYDYLDIDFNVVKLSVDDIINLNKHNTKFLKEGQYHNNIRLSTKNFNGVLNFIGEGHNCIL